MSITPVKLEDSAILAQVEGGTIVQKEPGTCGGETCSGSATTAKVKAM